MEDVFKRLTGADGAHKYEWRVHATSRSAGDIVLMAESAVANKCLFQYLFQPQLNVYRNVNSQSVFMHSFLSGYNFK